MKIIPMIYFNGQCDEAIELYKKAFNCKVKTLLHYSDAVNFGWEQPKPELDGRVYHSEIMFGDQEVRFCDNSIENAELSQKTVHVVGFDTAEEVETAFEILRDGGEVIKPLSRPPYLVITGTVRDKFGIQWQLLCDYK